MNSREITFINEDFYAEEVGGELMDRLLASGWRHFGKYFFRYSVAVHQGEYRLVLPLRIRLSEFSLTKSLRRIKRTNSDLKVLSGPTVIDEAKRQMFHAHKSRFSGHRPESIYHFLDPDAANVPGEGLEFCVYDGEGSLSAASFVDNTPDAISGIYAMFDPGYSKRSLGIYTLLVELDHAIEQGKEFYYLGYAYEGSSFYDYKKRFKGTEVFDWNGNWKKFEAR